ncbi:GSCFA domain-containing protein [Pseudoruegeria sp. HB172150]|uniref:GSCFA domain-containing protein n=1 Tax=Pseudoruegeria sp. HB172150 TaxID=2721164 RepID=UPI001556D211|nr:GSCFA domain-containing protein [Pseudoruegeria sp. HB172150]
MSESANPYGNLPGEAFWKSGVSETSPTEMFPIYRNKWKIPDGARIVTAGSCFAQHIARHLRQRGVEVVDEEPAPLTLPPERHQAYGFSMYSGRYGNIYTTAQLLQLAREALEGAVPQDIVWERGGRYFDALRPAVEPEGLESPEEVLEHRRYHVGKVREIFLDADVIVFTLGLTEAWQNAEYGTVYPTAPGTIAGSYDPERYVFRNYRVNEVLDDFLAFQQLLTRARGSRPALRFLLTVSPVPLTATAGGNHVLSATTYSKAVLRAAAGELAQDDPSIDYFPSFEIITNQAARGEFYDTNLRTVRSEGVEAVMKVFFAAHSNLAATSGKTRKAMKGKQNAEAMRLAEEDIACEEAVLEAFGR